MSALDHAPITALEHALAYAALGWRVCPIPPGFKHPHGIDRWQDKATTDCKRIRRYWTTHPDHGVCIATGPISGIFAIDIDPRHGGDEAWAELEHQHGPAPATVEAVTGGGGRHIIFTNPAGIIITNAADHLPLGIDVRGEGGQILVAPTIHPETGRAYAWEVEHDPLAGHLVLDPPAWLIEILTRPRVDQTPRRERSQPRSDSIVDRYNAAHTWPELLEADGWSFHSRRCEYGTGEMYELWTRPGKQPRQGASASLYYRGSDVLKVFTTGAQPLNGGETYTKFGYTATMRHHGDMAAMGRAARAELGGTTHTTFTEPEPPPPACPLGEAFWTARPVLAHIRLAARARLVAPTAVLGAVLARVAAFTPPSACLPAVIGSTQPLSLFVAFRGRSGAGKSTPAACAADLLPHIPLGCVGPLALGSGEGLVEAYMEMVEETVDGKKVRVKRQIKHGALFMLDEGQMLAEIASRRGSTVLPVLRTAWSGGDPGQANASIETRRHLRSGSYALGLISLWQDKAAALLLADADGGTPQRFVWLPTDDPEASKDRPEWPGPLEWEPLDDVMFGGVFELDPTIEEEIVEYRIAELQGTATIGALDAHRRLNKLKLAGVLAALETRREINIEDWTLAEQIMTLSDSVRNWVLAEARRRQEDQLVLVAKRAAQRESIIEGSAVAKALEGGARAAYRTVATAKGKTVSRRDISVAMGGRARKWITVDEAIGEAERLSWIVPDETSGWRTGKAKPS